MNSNFERLIFDIGMYDGSDTRYYLNEGFRVLAIEANPVLVQRARELLFQDEIKSGRHRGVVTVNGNQQKIYLLNGKKSSAVITSKVGIIYKLCRL